MAETTGLIVLRTVTVVATALMLLYGLRAYRRTRRLSLLVFVGGMAAACIGYAAEGLLVELGGWSLQSATTLESAFSLVAFSLLIASLWVTDRRSGKPQT